MKIVNESHLRKFSFLACTVLTKLCFRFILHVQRGKMTVFMRLASIAFTRLGCIMQPFLTAFPSWSGRRTGRRCRHSWECWFLLRVLRLPQGPLLSGTHLEKKILEGIRRASWLMSVPTKLPPLSGGAAKLFHIYERLASIGCSCTYAATLTLNTFTHHSANRQANRNVALFIQFISNTSLNWKTSENKQKKLL